METIKFDISASVPSDKYEDVYEYLAYMRRFITDKLHNHFGCDVESFLE